MSNNAANEAIQFGTKYSYDPQWKGPTEISRTPTDKNWLIGFLVYFFIYFACAVYAFVASDLKKLENHLDGTGHICGIDQDVIDKPYVMHLNLKQDSESSYYSPKVCVSQCPTENFMYDKSQPVDEIKPKLMCTDDVNIAAIQSIEEIDDLISEDKCARWYLKSRPLLDNCIADETWHGHEIDTISKVQLYNVKKEVLDGKYYLKKLYRICQWVWKPCLLTILGSAILTLLCILMLRYWSEPFFYISIVIFVALLTLAIYYLMELYMEVHDPGLEVVILVSLVICIILVIFIVVSVLCTRKKIHLACLLVEESAKSVLHLPATLVYPFISGVLEIAMLAFFIVYLLCLLTIAVPNYTIRRRYPTDNRPVDHGAISGYTYYDGCYCQGEHYEIGDSCDPDEFNNECTGKGQDCQWLHCRLAGEKTPAYVYVIHVVNALGLFWMACFISALEFMVLSGTFATWYWTLEKSVVGNYAVVASFVRTVRYHLGTIALGSLILTIAEIITSALQHGAQQQGTNTSGQLAMTMMYHQSDIFERVIEFLSKNAYVMCAVHGTNFFKSCKSAFNLIMRNLVKVIVVHTVADMLFMVAGLLVVTICIGGLAAYLHHTLGNNSDDEHWIFWVTIIVTFIGTAMVSNVFLEVISIAVHTIFLCFIEDTERNDGSGSRPYYMSSKLERLLQR